MTTMTQKWGANTNVVNGDLNDVNLVNATFNATADTFTKTKTVFNVFGVFNQQIRGGLHSEFPIKGLTTSTNLVSRDKHYAAGTAGTYTLQSRGILLDSAGSTLVAGVDYDVWGIIDELDNGSISSDTFTSGGTTCSESTDGITVPQASSFYTKDMSTLATGFYLKYYSFAAAVAGAALQFGIYDAPGTASAIVSVTGTGGGGNAQTETQLGELYINLDWNNRRAKLKNIYTFTRDSLVSGNASVCRSQREVVDSEIDLTGWTNFKFYMTTSNHANCTQTLYFIRKEKTNASSSIEVTASANGGNTFFKGMNGGVFDCTGAPGTCMVVKATGTIAGTAEVIAFKGLILGKVS
jgi:hypothetical protein